MRDGTLVATNITVEYGTTVVLDGLSLTVPPRARIGVVGPNGSGKSTLLAGLLGRLPLAHGRQWLGRGARVGELDQARSAFAGAEPLVEAFATGSGLAPRDARTLLAKFALGEAEATRPASTLSPGERTRATLALLSARGVNCLVLDEPTNHLDLEAIGELERVLAGFPGAVVLVTHDRRLLETFEATGRIELAPAENRHQVTGRAVATIVPLA